MKFIMLISLKDIGNSSGKDVKLIPEGGIWMNTQRPEWNEYNAGNGVLHGYPMLFCVR
jgi:hypothetical protein